MDKWKAAIIGLGQIGMMYDFDPKRNKPASHVLAYQLNEQINLVGAMDVKSEQRNLLAQLAPTANFYSDIEFLLDEQQPDIVSICTPPQFHMENIKSVISRTKPKIIFCEKPVAQNVDEAMEICSFIKKNDTLVIPNISRRWNSGMYQVKKFIEERKYGLLEKIHVKYTRGIYNTGAHLFDLLKMWTGNSIKSVQTFKKVYTSSEEAGELSFSFYFEQENGVHGFAEAFDDSQYYLFDIDLFFTEGKIEVKNSGDDVFYYKISSHHLFSGFKELSLENHRTNLLKESCLTNAVANIVEVLDKGTNPMCTFADAVYPLYVARALMKSYQDNNVEGVEYYE